MTFSELFTHLRKHFRIKFDTAMFHHKEVVNERKIKLFSDLLDFWLLLHRFDLPAVHLPCRCYFFGWCSELSANQPNQTTISPEWIEQKGRLAYIVYFGKTHYNIVLRQIMIQLLDVVTHHNAKLNCSPKTSRNCIDSTL